MFRRLKPFSCSFLTQRCYLSTTTTTLKTTGIVPLFNHDIPVTLDFLTSIKEKNISSKYWTYKYYSNLGLFRNWDVCSIDSPNCQILNHVTQEES